LFSLKPRSSRDAFIKSRPAELPGTGYGNQFAIISNAFDILHQPPANASQGQRLYKDCAITSFMISLVPP
jgi:hypothetical protein